MTDEGFDRAGVTRRTLGLAPLAAAVGATVVGSARADDAAAPSVVGAAAAGTSVADRVRAILPALQHVLTNAMADWHVPGAAIGVVVDGEVMLAAGFGERVAGGGAAVDADTVFQIGSATKAFCAATEAIIVDRGAMRWDDRVVDHDPGFMMWDFWVTREFRISDLLAQRSDLRPYVLDSMWEFGYPPDAVIAALRHVRPATSFRATFGYQNILQGVAGRIVARHAGVANWGDALRSLLLDPLGLTATTSTVAALLGAPNHARGHIWQGGRLRDFEPPPTFDHVGPAGAINSTVNDMLVWLRMQIGRGTIGGRQIISEQNLAETWLPRVALAGLPGFPIIAASYASGWIFNATANGHFIWHNGGTGQFRSHVGFLPEQRVGIVVLANEGTNELPDAVALWFYDRVLGNPEVDYSARRLAHAAAQRRKDAADAVPPQPPRPTGPLADYAGYYHSPVLGAAVITEAADGLRLTLQVPGAVLLLQPWSGDTFSFVPQDKLLAAMSEGSTQLVQFERTPRNAVHALHFVDSKELVLTRDA